MGRLRKSPSYIGSMNLELTEEETELLAREAVPDRKSHVEE
jgi:hypothetical protein